MQFGRRQEIKFGTLQGTYSIVTDTENKDSQITLTDYETEMVISHYGIENIHKGNVKSNIELSKKPFRLYPGGETVSLNIVFPKPEKTELRLYIAKGAGFFPSGGDVWFLFVKGKQLWIGSMNESAWRSDSSELKLDECDEFYQSAVNDSDKIRVAKLKERDIFSRDRNIAIQRMEQVNFKCEYDSEHGLFVSRFSKMPYLEVHHLIPLGLQKNFTKPLDTIHNVFCLCPYCHRAVHNADEPLARKILGSLAEKSPVLDNFSLTMPDLFGLYAVEEID